MHSVAVEDFVGTWMLAECAPRFTESTEQAIEAVGVPVYSPRQRVWRQEGFRRRCIEVPIFPGYVCACLPADQFRLAVRYAAHVYDIIEVSNQERFVKEMSIVEKMLSAGDVETFPGLVVGKAVRVRSGPLQGKEGFLESRGGRDRFVVRLEVFQQSVATEIDAALLEPV